ncbi:hypothetical protein D3C86_1780920 [compost metagenome]
MTVEEGVLLTTADLLAQELKARKLVNARNANSLFIVKLKLMIAYLPYCQIVDNSSINVSRCFRFLN